MSKLNINKILFQIQEEYTENDILQKKEAPYVSLINKNNFFNCTEATFELVDNLYDIQDLLIYTKPDFISKSNSRYWYNEEGVFRYSDHWGYVASCYWICPSLRLTHHNLNLFPREEYKLCFCKWKDFLWSEYLILENKRKNEMKEKRDPFVLFTWSDWKEDFTIPKSLKDIYLEGGDIFETFNEKFKPQRFS